MFLLPNNPITICKTNPNRKTNSKTDPNPKKTLTLKTQGEKMLFWNMETSSNHKFEGVRGGKLTKLH